jgi:hypothetical protein
LSACFWIVCRIGTGSPPFSMNLSNWSTATSTMSWGVASQYRLNCVYPPFRIVPAS